MPDDRVVQASEVSAKIRADETTDFDNCIIEGNLDLSGLKIADEVHFNNTRFEGFVNFNLTTFNSNAYFWGADFNGKADFSNAVFKGDAYFYGTGFNGEADFSDAGFNGTTYFWGAGFNSTADFYGAGFNDNAYFWGADFNGKADFRNAGFNGTTYFWGAAFNDTAYFWGAGFNGEADFEKANFNITDFSGAQFNKDANFVGSQFTGTTSFDNARFKEDALFEDADFNSQLSLTRTRYNKLYIRWYNISSFAYDDAAYMALMKNFKDLGYYEDYDSCYYNYRVAHRAVPWSSMSYLEEKVRKPIDCLLEWFYGYGTKPFNAFLFSLAIVLVFALLWWRVGLGGLKDKTREILKDKTDKGQEDVEDWPDGGIFDILAFSATVFLSGTRLFIDPPPLPRIEGRSRSLIKKAFILERVLGALFSVLFFIAISGTIARAS